eukprot:TRINITY_DN61248_c0_g1_i1.p1 TRINITY_DN61248_c0_g1~~TRINITY_DN61248_c0_g1_i1.p1  ORF type:complete len:528 (-),score=100.12 TRINITY_DN61248_c0_g1_i1:55-1638(-)
MAPPSKRPASARPQVPGAKVRRRSVTTPAVSSAFTAAAATEAENGDVMDTVVKVFAAVSEPNYAVPWVYKPQDARTGTAFAVACLGSKQSERWLLTNAHVARHAAVVQVRKRGDHKKFMAKILCLGLECDLAILTVENAKFWQGLPCVALNWSLPVLQDEVTVVGFPVGGDNVSVTVGVVSRIDMQRYSVAWHKSLLAIQIDAAINSGNSGGPCFHEDCDGQTRCIGVAFQVLGRDDAENIGYIIPSEVVKHFLDDYLKNGCYTGFGSCGLCVQALENARMRAALGLSSGQSGMLVRRVDPASPASKVIAKGDILCAVEGQIIGDDGKVPFRGTQNERIDFGYLISKLFVGDACSLGVMHKKKYKTVKVKLTRIHPLVLHDPPDPPPYFVVGGMVFVPLSEPFLVDDFGANFHKDAPLSLISHWSDGIRKFDGHEIIVISQILASPLTVGFTDYYNVVLVKFNGREPRNLEHLIRMVKSCKDEYFTFEIERDHCIVLPRKEALRETPAILKANRIPMDRSAQYASLK